MRLRTRTALAVVTVTTLIGCSTIPVTPQRGQDTSTVNRDRYWCTQVARQEATVWTQRPPSEAGTALSALGLAAMLGGIALAVISAPFSPGAAASGLLTGGVDIGSGASVKPMRRAWNSGTTLVDVQRPPAAIVQCPGTS